MNESKRGPVWGDEPGEPPIELGVKWIKWYRDRRHCSLFAAKAEYERRHLWRVVS